MFFSFEFMTSCGDPRVNISGLVSANKLPFEGIFIFIGHTCNSFALFETLRGYHQ